MSILDEFRKLVTPIVKGNPKGRPIDEQGRFYGNPVPLEPPIGYKRQPSLTEQIRDMVRSEKLAQETRDAGFETFEEGDDFDVQDDFDPRSPFEYNFDPRMSDEDWQAFTQNATPEPSKPGVGAAEERGAPKAPPDDAAPLPEPPKPDKGPSKGKA